MADDGEMDGEAVTQEGEGAPEAIHRMKRGRRVIKLTSRNHSFNVSRIRPRGQVSDDVSDDDDTTNGVNVGTASTVTPSAAHDHMKTESNNNHVTEGQAYDGTGDNNNEDDDDFYDESYEGEWVWPGDDLDDTMRGRGNIDSESDDYFDAEEGDYINTILESTDSAQGTRRRGQQRQNSGGSDSSGGRRSFRLYDEVNLSVDSASSEHAKHDKVYYVCNELLQTEVEFVKRLEVIVKTKDLAAMLFGADVAKNMFRDVDIILGLHKNELLPKLKQRLENWDNCPAVGDIMSDFAPCLKLYSRYVANFEKAIEMVNSYEAKCPQFKKYAKELVIGSKMHGLKVQSFMLEPVQRVPRYELLIKDYLKKLPETSPDRANAENALELIHRAAAHYEAEIKKDSDMSRLLVLQAEMDGPVNLLDSHRELLKQGPVTLHRAKDDKLVDRTAFLFSDLLLICQDTLLGLKAKYKVKHVVHLSTAKISDGSNEKQSLFFVRTKNFVLEFRFNTVETMRGWYEGISQQIFECRAKNKIRRRRSVKRGSVTNQTGENFVTRNIGKRAPILVHAQDVRQCAVCNAVFKRMAKKHHCEACGQVVCAHCCTKRMALEYAPDEKKRVCDRCHPLLLPPAKQHSASGGERVKRNFSTSSSIDSIAGTSGAQMCLSSTFGTTRLHLRVRPRQSLPIATNESMEDSAFYDEANEPEETEQSANQNHAQESHVTRVSRSASQSSNYYEEVVFMPCVKGAGDMGSQSNSQKDGVTASQSPEVKKNEAEKEVGKGQQLKRGLSKCLIRGRLRLSTDSGKTWRHLLCVLRDSSMLQAYADPEDIKPCLTIPMKHTVCSEFMLPLSGTPGQQVNTGVPCIRLVLHKTAKEFLLQPEDQRQFVAWRKALTAPSSTMLFASASISKLSFNTATSALVSTPVRLELAAAPGVC